MRLDLRVLTHDADVGRRLMIAWLRAPSSNVAVPTEPLHRDANLSPITLNNRVAIELTSRLHNLKRSSDEIAITRFLAYNLTSSIRHIQSVSHLIDGQQLRSPLRKYATLYKVPIGKPHHKMTTFEQFLCRLNAERERAKQQIKILCLAPDIPIRDNHAVELRLHPTWSSIVCMLGVRFLMGAAPSIRGDEARYFCYQKI
ncbi:uncharacterized protein FOMMEDRAFT_154288 [Fomitiporia mediterranea MF3/22]|uniref:uncharacterized protein n=1 Tax=Fomitiporia mediterranea (strain MF3/22) TaxID=694068 RepID=UPI000440819A|nr:uncharacterized protein FOMMEDRAFT_154288 [Fomitiporia mediterranea MF3/22]EJD05105.1 hypothetical protein FOMMEDRAFT_154288 [Fomitiporia mediterranea MF3/22]